MGAVHSQIKMLQRPIGADEGAKVPKGKRKNMHMAETVYNLFLIYRDDVCAEVRYVAHDVDLSDQEALDFLLGRVALDLNNSTAIPLTKPFTKAEQMLAPDWGMANCYGKRFTYFSKQVSSP